jgi:hypothetical protein
MVNTDQITQTLNKHFEYTGKVTIDPHIGTVSCTGSVRWKDSKVSQLPVKFGKVRGSFNISWGSLVTLEGAPHWVGRDFTCFMNNLTSLAHAPSHVGGSFDCGKNQLKSLAHVPVHIGKDFSCAFNELTTLDHAPSRVNGYFFCMGNQLTSLQGAPRVVMGELRCWRNKFQSLEGVPEEIQGSIWLDVSDQLPMLKLLAVQGLTEVVIGVRINKMADILNKYVGKGKHHMLNCALELKQAEFVGNARW